MHRYKSAVNGRWDRNATVRVAPRPIHAKEGHFDYFSRKLVPAVNHPILLQQPTDAQQALLIHHNYAFSRATSKLETDILNPTLLTLAEGFENLPLPEDLRFDARSIYADESYHALVAEDGIRRIAAQTGVEFMTALTPEGYRELDRAAAEFGHEHFPLVRFLFSFVLETLVSDTFTVVPDDPAVHPFVRESVGQHRKDERVHHEFFRAAFRAIWPGLSPREKRIGAAVIPRFIQTFTEPDDAQLRMILWAVGLSAAEADAVVTGSAPLPVDGRAAARFTLRYCRQAGVTKDPEAARLFRMARLID
ncbi:MAG: diiron oxygenase [Acidobacteriaceae bacterium]|jgi:hypothetical protein|nr:diiron oxygenase [Acidobacteriaceae bacterium]